MITMKHQTIDTFFKLSKKLRKFLFYFIYKSQKNFGMKQLINFINNLDNKEIIIIQPHQRTNRFIKIV